MQPVQLFEHLIWRGHYDGDLSELKARVEFLLDNSKNLNTALEMDGGISSSSDPNAPHTWSSTRPFLSWASNHISSVWQHWGFPNEHLIVRASWANRHPTGAWTNEHQHRSTPLVVVLYVDQPEGGGNLEIADPLFYHWNYSKKPTNSTWREIPIQTGDVVIFPGWINHRTQKNTSEQDRLVISFNINVG